MSANDSKVPVTARWYSCPHCGKRAFDTRSAAKRALKRAHPGAKNMHPYRSDSCGGIFHYGHQRLPSRDSYRKSGDRTRDRYRRTA